jgi:hypothetical protein
LIGFGDNNEGAWLDKHEFTADAAAFRQWVKQLKRFQGGDLPESALDALEEGLKLPVDEHAIRQFYLVTDAPYHEPSQSGATAAAIAGRLREQSVVLYVFSRREYGSFYTRLLGETGKLFEIEDFGKVIGQGRVLEE